MSVFHSKGCQLNFVTTKVNLSCHKNATSIARMYREICFTLHSSMFKWSTEYMIESYCPVPVMMSDQRKGKCSWAQCVNTSVVINLELTCHTWDLSGKLSEIIDTTASADPFFPISKLVNVSCSEMSLEPSHCPMSYSLAENQLF